MTGSQSFLSAIGAVVKAAWNRLASKDWWKALLWGVWFIVALSMIWAVFGSMREYEPRAALMYGIVFLILIIIGGICFRKGRALRTS
jgi:hypothetical protein